MTEHSAKIVIIGTGNMGRCLLHGLVRNGYPPQLLWGCDKHIEHLSPLEPLGINITTNNEEAVANADVCVFAVKPQHMTAAVMPLAETLKKRHPLLLSVAAGIRTAQLAKWSEINLAVVRAMPNTPALIGSGATVLFANKHVKNEQKALAESIMRGVGLVLWVTDEAQMDTVTALSGSGPAYFFYVMESLQKSAQQLGLSKEDARILTIQTALGSARLALETDEELSTLREHVTSRGGTTESALAVLRDGNLAELFQQALTAAKNRSEELANLFEENNG